MKILIIISIELFLFLTALSQACLPEGITFASQAQIDIFQIDYPNCTEIEGDVIIGNPDGSDITNLNGLSVLTSIGGSLIIGGNHSLFNFTGLDNLNIIGGNLQIYIVKYIPDGYYFVGNQALTSLMGLANLTSIGGNLEIIKNGSLSTCESQWLCNYLFSPNGIINIYGNAPGCNSVVEIAHTCGDSIPCLPYGNYYLSTQSDIENFPTSFPDCTDLEGDLTINGYKNITDLNGLNALTSIGGDLDIFRCAITNLRAFENITSIGRHLLIEYNDLDSLTGLENLTSINGCLYIIGNYLLTSLTGLDNIESGSITNIMISNNYNLSNCEVQSVCDYLAFPNGEIDIHDNTTGCNNQAEVESACGVGMYDHKIATDQINIYPNPTSTIITIETTEILNPIELTILNLNGRKLDHYPIMEPRTVIDISHLTAGVYFVKFTSETVVRMIKVVKY